MYPRHWQSQMTRKYSLFNCYEIVSANFIALDFVRVRQAKEQRASRTETYGERVRIFATKKSCKRYSYAKQKDERSSSTSSVQQHL